MDAKFINPILESVVEILSTMAEIKPKTGKPSLKEGNVAKGVVTGLIELKGQQTSGSVAISLSKPVALDLVKRMLRMDITEIDDMTLDLVGELANMTAGGAKVKLEEKGYQFDMTLPSVLSGEKHTIKHFVDGPTILLPFTTEAGDFFVELCFT